MGPLWGPGKHSLTFSLQRQLVQLQQGPWSGFGSANEDGRRSLPGRDPPGTGGSEDIGGGLDPGRETHRIGQCL